MQFKFYDIRKLSGSGLIILLPRLICGCQSLDVSLPCNQGPGVDLYADRLVSEYI